MSLDTCPERKRMVEVFMVSGQKVALEQVL